MADVRRRSLLGTLGALSAFGPLSMDVYLPSLPELSADLAAPEALAQFTMSACMIGLALGQLLWGSISDRYGRRTPLLWAVAGFAVTSVLCAFAPSIQLLILFRFLEGLCGAAGMVIARAIVHDVFEGPEATGGYAALAAIAGAAPVLAPLLGGLLVTFTDWRGVFIALAVVGAILLAVAALFVPETHPPAERTTGGFGNDLRGFGAALGNGRFMLAAVVLALASVGMFSYLQMSPFVLQSGYRVGPQGFALIFALNSIGIVTAAQISRRLARRMPGNRVVLWSLSLATAAAVAVLLTATLGAPLPWLLVPLFFAVASHGVNNPTLTALALGRITHGAGSASAVLGTLTLFLGALIPPLVSGGGVSATLMGTTMACAFACALALTIGAGLVRRRRERG